GRDDEAANGGAARRTERHGHAAILRAARPRLGGLRRARSLAGGADRIRVRSPGRVEGGVDGGPGRVQAPPGPAGSQDHAEGLRQRPPPAHHQCLYEGPPPHGGQGTDLAPSRTELVTPVVRIERAVSSVVEQGAFNPRVAGSIPARPTGVPTPTAPSTGTTCLPGRRAEDVVVPEVRRAIAERPRRWEDEVPCVVGLLPPVIHGRAVL